MAIFITNCKLVMFPRRISLILVAARREDTRLSICVITCEVSQPIWTWYLNVTDRQRDRQTDTSAAILCSALCESHAKKRLAYDHYYYWNRFNGPIFLILCYLLYPKVYERNMYESLERNLTCRMASLIVSKVHDKYSNNNKLVFRFSRKPIAESSKM